MKIIFLTQYFPPETGAPQNRLHATASSLKEQGAQVTVLTAMPNYPDMRVQKGYRRKFYVREELDGLDVHRAWIFVSAGRGMLARLCNYFSFVGTSLLVGLFKLRKADILMVESPPLFLGISAMLLARAKGAHLVFNVSDLWPESAVQLGLVSNPTLIRISTWLEDRCYRRAALITGQTQGIVAHIKQRHPEKQVLWVPNGVDLRAITKATELPSSHIRGSLGIETGDLVLAYTGIVGHAQGLDVILEAAVLLREHKDIHFLIIGDGPEKQRLMEMALRIGPTQVYFVDRMQREELLGTMRSIDAVVVPLRRNDLFKGAIPSKIFEALALSKPLLLGVEGEAKELFIDEGGAGLAFTPEDPQSLANAVLIFAGDREMLLRSGADGARYVRERFDREAISSKLWQAFQALVPRTD